MSGNKMIAVVKKSQDYKDKIRKIAVTINAPVFEKYQACNIQWKRSTYSRFGEKWESFSPVDRDLFDLDRINKETIALNVRISTLFMPCLHCSICYHYFYVLHVSHLLPSRKSDEKLISMH